MTDAKKKEKRSIVAPQFLVLGFIVGMLVFGIFMISKFFMPDFLRRIAQDGLREGAGIVAPAQIVSVTYTGRRYATNPVVSFNLNVSPAGQPSFTLTMEQEVTVVALNQLVPGRSVQVRYRPEKPTQAVIVGQ